MDKLVFGFGGLSDMTPCIYRAKGPHPYANPEYNILAVETVETFAYLGWNNKFLPEENKVGNRMGGGLSGLFEVTDEQIEFMRSENARCKAAKAVREKAEIEELTEYTDQLKKSGLCPKCGTWCWGDCEAN